MKLKDELDYLASPYAMSNVNQRKALANILRAICNKLKLLPTKKKKSK